MTPDLLPEIVAFIQGSDVCPYCGNEDYEGEGPRDGYAGILELLYDLKCNSCKKEWTAVYKLHDVLEKE